MWCIATKVLVEQKRGHKQSNSRHSNTQTIDIQPKATSTMNLHKYFHIYGIEMLAFFYTTVSIFVDGVEIDFDSPGSGSGASTDGRSYLLNLQVAKSKPFDGCIASNGS